LEPIKKVLITRFSSLGDIFNITPVIRCISKQSDWEIHLVTKAQYQSVFERNKYLQKVIVYRDNWQKIVNEVKDESYDLIIDLHKNIRSYRLRIALGIKTVSFNKLKLEKWLYTSFKKDRLPDGHLVHRYFEELSHYNIKYDGAGLDYFVQDDEKIGPVFPSYYCINISASKETKRIPQELVVKLINESDQKFILIGGKDVIQSAKSILGKVNASQVLNRVGQTSLNQSALIISKSEMLITGDTSMMHLCAALKHPMIVLWGPTTKRLGLYGLYPDGQDLAINIQQTGLSCQPCHHIGFDICPQEHWECMRQFSANDLILAMNEFKNRN